MSLTYDGASPGESHVAQDLERICKACLAAGTKDDLRAIFLLGGYARGEGTVIQKSDGSWRGFNDYDLILVFGKRPHASPYQELSQKLAQELEIDFVDLGVAGLEDLAVAPPTLFWYELGEAHLPLWERTPGEVELPRFVLSELDPAEGSRLMVNRGMALLWGALKLFPKASEDWSPADVLFTRIAAHKAILSAGDAALLRGGQYKTSQAGREALVQTHAESWSWAGEGFAEAYSRAVRFRRTPLEPDSCDLPTLWREARAHHEAGFRAAEETRLAASLDSWESHRSRVTQKANRDLFRSPRSAAGVLRRRLAGEALRDTETQLFESMPNLLYHLSLDQKLDATWQDAANDLVRLWHP